MPGVPDQLGEFLTYLVKNRPELRIFVLRLDLSFLRFPFRAALPSSFSTRSREKYRSAPRS